MNPGRPPNRGPADGGRFRHEAALYAGPEQFVARTAAFVRDSLAAEQPIMVAVAGRHRSLLREELGVDARHVQFVAMEQVGRNPARIIPALRDWVAQNAAADRGFRGIGEPVWAARTPAELVECQQHEALLNTAFDDGPPWWLLCPYDVESLDDATVDSVYRTHPSVLSGGLSSSGPSSRANAAHLHPQYSRSALLAAPLPEPRAVPFTTAFATPDLPRLRHAVDRLATAAGLPRQRIEDLVLVANELACNSILHGGGTGTMRLWREPGTVVCEVRDRGVIRDPLVGRTRPDPTAEGGAGLWIANQVCDLVQIRSTPGRGTTVRVHMGDPRADTRGDGGATGPFAISARG